MGLADWSCVRTTIVSDLKIIFGSLQSGFMRMWPGIVLPQSSRAEHSLGHEIIFSLIEPIPCDP